ncbi:MAG: hypothetical protein RLZZ385_2057 [Pseudomonadota bacterium]|jgi:hypothetical protein
MKWTHYFLLCSVVAALIALSILYVPGVADTIERELLAFLSTNAR